MRLSQPTPRHYHGRSRDAQDQAHPPHQRADKRSRADSSEHYTYLHDPDGNMIELVHHPLGLEDADGNKVEVPHDRRGVRWTLRPGLADPPRPS